MFMKTTELLTNRLLKQLRQAETGLLCLIGHPSRNGQRFFHSAAVHAASICVRIREDKYLPVNLSTIDTICRLTDCQPGDILEYVPDETAKPE